MNYLNINECDTVNGAGIRVSLTVSGCSHNCAGCFMPDSHNYKAGKEYTPEVEDYILSLLAHKHVSGISILGGDPLAPKNRETVQKLCKRVKEELPDKTIWVWTGYVAEEVMECLEHIDVLVDGKFVQELADPKLLWKGSSNQRVLML